jgi:hypothetical protein
MTHHQSRSYWMTQPANHTRSDQSGFKLAQPQTSKLPLLPQTSTTPSPPGQCSSNVQPPPSPGARLPALLPSPSAPSLPPSFAVRNSSNGLIRPSHNCSNPRAPRPQGAVYRQLQLTWSTYCDYQLTPNSYSQREEVGSQAGGQDPDFRWLVLYPIPQQSIAFLPASAARNLLF